MKPEELTDFFRNHQIRVSISLLISQPADVSNPYDKTQSSSLTQDELAQFRQFFFKEVADMIVKRREEGKILTKIQAS